jgi:hypothetical protein
MKRLLAAASLSLGIAGMATTAVIPASAAANSPVHPAVASPSALREFVTDTPHGDTVYNCKDGPNFNNPVTPITNVGSGCTVRLWLHEYTNYVGRGWAFCIDPVGGGPIPSQYQDPANIEVSSNTSNC